MYYSVCYRAEPSGVIAQLGSSDTYIQFPGNYHVTLSFAGTSALGELAAGTYSVGLCGNTSGPGVTGYRANGWVMLHN